VNIGFSHLSHINAYQTVEAKKMGEGRQKSNTSHDRVGGANRISDGMYAVLIKMKTQSLLLFFGTWLVYLAFLSPGIYSIDGSSMLAVADSLVTQHDVTVPAGLGMKGRDGNFYSRWYPLQSLLAVPVVALAVKTSVVLRLPLHYVESLSVTILPALYTALTVPVVYFLALSLESSQMGAWLAALAYAFGTIGLVYTRDFYADPLLALLMALGLLLAFRPTPTWMIFPVTCLAVLAKPTGLILGPVLSVYMFWKTRRFWPSLMPGLGSAVGLALYCSYNYYRFGSFRTFGQPWTFSIRFLPEGLAGMVISPGAGLIWYCPCVVLSVYALFRLQNRRLEAWAIVALGAASMLLHSMWAAWNGGWSWGPRLLLPILPGLVALTGTLNDRWRKLLVLSAVLGFLLTAPNLLSSYTRYLSEANEEGVSEAALMWRPSRSPLLHAWPAAYRQILDARHSDVRVLLAQSSGIPASKISDSRALRIVAVWWWLLPVVHISRVWGVLTSVFLVACGIWMILLARPQNYRPPAE
jgi:hypothetical protein